MCTCIWGYGDGVRYNSQHGGHKIYCRATGGGVKKTIENWNLEVGKSYRFDLQVKIKFHSSIYPGSPYPCGGN
jgi:hypothetical protein